MQKKRKRKEKQKQPSHNFCLSNRFNWVLDLVAHKVLLWSINRPNKLVFFGPHFANLMLAAAALWPNETLTSWKVMHCIVQKEIVYNPELLPHTAQVHAILMILLRYTQKHGGGKSKHLHFQLWIWVNNLGFCIFFTFLIAPFNYVTKTHSANERYKNCQIYVVGSSWKVNAEFGQHRFTWEMNTHSNGSREASWRTWIFKTATFFMKL